MFKGKKVLVAVVLVIILTTVSGLSTAAGQGEGNYVKHETIYVNLLSDGVVDEINVVNSFTGANGEIIDFGRYEEIINLTSNVQAVISGEEISFAIGEEEEFYYQGRLAQKELPWDFAISYELDGRQVEATELSGAAGDLEITLKIESNEDAASYYLDHYMLQISVPLDLGRSRNIVATEATKVVVGQQAMLTFAVLPGEDATFKVEATVNNFAMGPIEITAVNSNLSIEGIEEEISSGFGQLSDGLKEMIDGTGQLRDGMADLHGGIDELHSGVLQLDEGKNDLLAGMQSYYQGLSQFRDSLPQLEAGFGQILAGLQEAEEGREQLVAAYGGIEAGLAEMLAHQEQLEQLAGALLHSPDPFASMLAEAMLQQLGGVAELYGGIGQANAGLAEYAAGMETLTSEYGAFHAGFSELNAAGESLLEGYDQLYQGTEQFMGGIGEVAKGTGELKSETAAIPSEVQKLVDGQKEMDSGITEARESLEEFTKLGSDAQPVSFVAPEQAFPETVQFIIRTPEIEKRTLVADADDAGEDESGFWQRLLNLFARR